MDNQNKIEPNDKLYKKKNNNNYKIKIYKFIDG